ncbi:tetratricopeptide repeat protein [Aliifodinibius sp. S!AR15-10]|uniref:tetratricopeptide repeat protein n=1 Tax=Aliifodinibius sp. S!AR15-10 TaxID=2950437 RepID=UPI00285A77B9|nr:tetratricopeptide repeat protein [Aliifodinibius sp. S!AR15-10]MDR8391782.1 tetratricopeptide repeat protein [Aliifodinibius sp. S!AR15-10]
MKKHRYPGVKPFSVTESNLFFGREWDINRLFKLVNVKQLVVLYSKSGLGKSSLINAGLLPKIKNETNYKPIIVRFGGYREGQATPPLTALKSKISTGERKKTLLDKLAVPDESLWYHLKSEQLNSGEEIPPEHLLIFDQFEELFTYPGVQILEFKRALSEALYSSVPKYYQSALEESFKEDQHVLTDEELELLYKPVRLKVLCAIRSDRLSLVDQLKDYIPDILVNTYQLSPLTVTQAEEAILSPAYLQDSDFISPPFDYSEEAIDKIVSFLTKDGAQDIESFQLQILCQYIEESIVLEGNDTYVKYEDVGDLRDIFETYYDKLISRLPESEQLSVRRFLEEGLIFEEEERRLSLYEGQIHKTYGISKELLQKLVDTHIIRPEPNTAGGFSYELSHDSLVKPILRAYHKRRDEEERALEEKRRQEEYEAYKERLLKKTKKIRRRFIYGGAAAIVAAILVVIFFVMSQSYREAQQDLRRMEFLVDTEDWYRNLVLNFDNDTQKEIYIRSTEESASLLSEVLDIGLQNERLIEEGTLKNQPQLMSLNIANQALEELSWDKNLAIQLARGAIELNDNIITQAVLDEVLARTNFNLQSFEVNNEVLLALGFRDEGEVVKVTPADIELLEIQEQANSFVNTSTRSLPGWRDHEFDNSGVFGSERKHFADVTRSGHRVVTIDTVSNKLEIWEGQDNGFRRVQTLSQGWRLDYNRISNLAISNTGNYVAVSHNDGNLICINLEDEAFDQINLRDLTKLGVTAPHLRFSPDSKFLLIFAPNSVAAAYNIENQRITKQWRADRSQFTFGHGNNYLVSVIDNQVRVEHVDADPDSVKEFNHNEPVSYAAFSPGNRYVIAEGRSGRFHIWDVKLTQKPVKQLNTGSQDPYFSTYSTNIAETSAADSSSLNNVNFRMTSPPPVIFSESGEQFLTRSGNQIYIWETPYVLIHRQKQQRDAFYARYNITELNESQKIAYNIVSTDSLLAGEREELLNLARNYYDAEKYEMAIEFYNKVIDISEVDELSIEVYNELGNSYYGVGKYQQAIPHYERALEIDPDYKWALGNLGLVYNNLKEDELAIEYHKKALAIDPLFTASLNGLGNVYYEQKKYKESIPYYQKSVESDPLYKWSWRNLGMALYYEGRYDEAYESLAEVLEIDPAYNIALEWNQLGNGFYEEKNYDRALLSYQNAVRVDPGYKWALYNLGNVEFARENYYNSYLNFKKALDADPQYSDAVVGMIDAYEAGYAAESGFAELLGESNWIKYCRAKVYVRNKQLNEAYREFLQISSDFSYPKAYDWIELGTNFLGQGEQGLEMARSSFERAVQLAPSNYSTIASTYYSERRYQEAVEFQERAVEYNPHDTNELWNLSWYQLFAGRFQDAIVNSRKVVNMDSTQTGVYTNLALGYLFNGQYNEAEKVYLEWMDKEYPFDTGYETFRNAFLKDLEDLEAAGVTHPDVTRIRSLLSEKRTNIR